MRSRMRLLKEIFDSREWDWESVRWFFKPKPLSFFPPLVFFLTPWVFFIYSLLNWEDFSKKRFSPDCWVLYPQKISCNHHNENVSMPAVQSVFISSEFFFHWSNLKIAMNACHVLESKLNSSKLGARVNLLLTVKITPF